ncbi:hypothetical protein [Thioalkalivibrio versutus]|uniref:hypothetical protein n=1 Tax=Thioalkalivibrio versutus TaxID=106634 RepID=UPI000A422401|nr:hypothetical protein [Thioalkalivibrio versutus]
MDIRPVTPEDVPVIHNIASHWLLSNLKDPENTGFLISNYTEEDYLKWIGHADYFWVAEKNGEIQGFLLAYNQDKIQPSEVVNSCLRYTIMDKFTLIKQICSAPNTKGVSSALYCKLFSNMSADFALAAVVNEPLNTRSIGFHRHMGFKHLWDMTPPADFDGVVRARSIWFYSRRKNPDSGCADEPQTRIPTADKDELLTQLIEKEQSAAQLYMHEDNLNWTKLGMLVTFMTAFFTAFAILIERSEDMASAVIIPILIIAGLAINLMFLQKIKSGVIYMTHHKKNLQRFDEAVSNLCPSMPHFLNHETKQTSFTVKWLYWLPLISNGIWIFCSIWLVLVFFVL